MKQDNSTPWYDEQIDYKRDLLERIMSINWSIDKGMDGMKQLSLLWSELKADIQKPILGPIKIQTDALAQDYKDIEIEVMEKWPDTLSPGHKRQIIEARARPIIQQTVLNCKTIIINQLDKMGLLLRDGKNVPQGIMPRLSTGGAKQ